MAVRGRTAIFPHQIDRTVDCNANVAYEHKEVHAGDCFYNTYYSERDTAELISIRLKTPNTTKWSHLLFEIAAQGKILVELRETITDNFGAGAAFNRNRNYPSTPTTILEQGVVAATAGTVIWNWLSGSTIGAFGGTVPLIRSSCEIVLKQNEKYELRVTSGVDNNTINSYVTWYEHTNIE